MSAPGQVWDAVVVGGGVAGLTAAHGLRARGLRVLVLEAGARCGGPVRGGTLVRADGARLAVDVGAESFAARGTGVAALAGSLGLHVVEPSGASAWIRTADDVFPIPAAGVLGIPGDPWAADVRRAVGLRGALRASLDRWLPAGRTDASDLGALVRSRLGARVVDRLVAPVAAGVHSAPLDALDVDAVAPGLRAALDREGSLAGAVRSLRALAPAGSAVRGVEGGVHGLVTALVAAVEETPGVGPAGTVRTGAHVSAVFRTRTDGAWSVLVDGAGDPVLARRLVVAAPGVVDLVQDVGADGGPTGVGVTPPRPAGTDVRLVTLLLDAPALDAAPRGTGVLVAPGTDVGAKALTHATAKWPWLAERVRSTFGAGRHVVRLSYGRLGVPTPEPTLARAVADAATLLGTPLAPSAVEAHLSTRWDGTLPPPTPDYRRAVADVAARADAVPGLALTGGWVAGTGLAAVVGHASAAVAEL
ncbi:oxygen-dependent protoporphyrinogen oxidase [Sediminihabitans luteus]|uniref:Oxygen-dependent protoporphyrinogen oxidase n=1 Tax=Sediminihabitans luteus TaxID=1138585 RepID=A0A2M9D0N6_9CELL|nr:FAD-dependent oxidoreductase [Sediminihabitans luteus]PJJ77752.1 oxygen-dependent protoporphyrinogen oxidase [Sediminihabitans luteus]GIJ00021.1 protoporphyrinogen oxidase [Sediminihabitans luteus]